MQTKCFTSTGMHLYIRDALLQRRRPSRCVCGLWRCCSVGASQLPPRLRKLDRKRRAREINKHKSGDPPVLDRKAVTVVDQQIFQSKRQSSAVQNTVDVSSVERPPAAASSPHQIHSIDGLAPPLPFCRSSHDVLQCPLPYKLLVETALHWANTLYQTSSERPALYKLDPWQQDLAFALQQTCHKNKELFSRQQLADVAWSLAHFDRDLASELKKEMGVPFEVVPCFLPTLQLREVAAEVEFKRDTIWLDGGARAVQEARATAWQSDIGATFVYSGKEMVPQPGGLTPEIAKVRDELLAMTGEHYDSVLINFYEDGKCGMRFHSDPLYERWSPNSAVVSVGATRRFVFRSVSDHSQRWLYRVRNGDVVVMGHDCQERLQHSIAVEPHSSSAGPRISLVFKQRLKAPDGSYL